MVLKLLFNPQESVNAITRDLKVETPLRTIIFVCKVACPGLSSENREVSPEYDKIHCLLGRGVELLMACSLLPCSAMVTNSLMN